jgi:LuxR family transcriptional regulator, maltose regulon positive regulatory protein
MTTDPEGTRRRIIPRPRLTTLLDESPARIKLLVAPAGYGKTTLAQEWLQVPKRRDVWYRGGPAAADVAALAAGIALALSQRFPEAGKRMRQRLPATGHPEEDVEILAELLAEDVQKWHSDTWLVIDDYQFAMESPASERFVDLLTHHSPIQLLITSRRRPSWATARRILYGEVQELDHRSLAMNEQEATQVLADRRDAAALVERARGWPAVLGIAVLTPAYEIPADDLPDELYEYFAEELYQGLRPELRDALHRLALVPSFQLAFAQSLLGVRAQGLLQDCIRIGALTSNQDELIFHPLLRTFLNKRLLREDPGALRANAKRLAELLISLGDWDAAFQVISTYAEPELIVSLTNAAVEALLTEGRTPTLLRWLDFAAENHLSDAVLDFAEAEVVFRQGQYAKAEALADQAASSSTGPLLARMLIRAGQSAVMDSRDDRALLHFRTAQRTAKTDLERVESAAGACFAALELGRTDDASQALDELLSVRTHGNAASVRKTVVQLVYSARVGGVHSALEIAATTLPLVDGVKDPLVVTSFLNSYGHLLSLGARYPEALEVAEREIEEAERYRLPFALPHAHLIRAAAHCGLRDFAKATADAARAEELSTEGDVYIAMQAAALRAKVALCRQDFATAVAQSSKSWERSASAPMTAEYLAYGALCQACLGETRRAETVANQARQTHISSVETQTLTACAGAIAAVREGKVSASRTAMTAYALIQSTGAQDALVTSVRAQPRFLAAILDAGVAPTATEIGELLARSNDFRLARSVGLEIVGVPLGPMAELTLREWEVADLVAQGQTNQEIADRLFISLSTVKVHIRHILKKLNARTRAEIAARTIATRPRSRDQGQDTYPARQA